MFGVSETESQAKGKGVGGPQGRGATGSANAPQNDDPSVCVSPGRAGVVIRAYVEHVGVVGETELTVNVKWPATAFCVKPAPYPPDIPPNPQITPGNGPQSQAPDFDVIFGERSADPSPFELAEQALAKEKEAFAKDKETFLQERQDFAQRTAAFEAAAAKKSAKKTTAAKKTAST
ncbi:hypothetical protein [Granulicella sibirica]|uniref:hypothetical protein n=1 Tax=Granulicella sibirica TaxID=2479048 RepID=UPI001008ACB8|nr:hypothetical protein [Granulicella sibirica]